MSFTLSDKQRIKKEEFALFAKESLDLGDHFPAENLEKAAERGYMGLPIPIEWGGRGEDFLTYILMIEEVSRVCASTGVILAVHTSVGSFPLLYFGSETQKQKYLPGLAGGKMLGAFALTEAGAGSDAASLATTARKVDGGYLLNGNKLFITSGGKADLYTVFATIDPALGTRGITAFIVERGMAGLTAGPPEKKMGLNRSHTTELQMEDLFVPMSNRMGEEGEGFRIAMSLLDGGRIGIAAQGLGIARACLDYTVSFFKTREAGRERTGQAVLFSLADLAARLEAASLLTYRAAAYKEVGRRCSKEASMAKLFCTDLAMETATRCLDLLGKEAGVSDCPLCRYFCDAKAPQIYEGSNQIQRIVVAREILRS
jgi:acyl-CoA dehydrogenase